MPGNLGTILIGVLFSLVLDGTSLDEFVPFTGAIYFSGGGHMS